MGWSRESPKKPQRWVKNNKLISNNYQASLKYAWLMKKSLEFSTVLNCSGVRGGVRAGVILQFLKLLHSNITSWFSRFQNVFGKLQTPVNRHTTTVLVYFRKIEKLLHFSLKAIAGHLKNQKNISCYRFSILEFRVFRVSTGP